MADNIAYMTWDDRDDIEDRYEPALDEEGMEVSHNHPTTAGLSLVTHKFIMASWVDM